ncbi:MAG: lipid II:glycine glycyltransferase FemX [Terriglobia bacterium]
MRPLEAEPVQIEWHPGLPIYASPAILKSEGGTYGWIGGLDPAGQLRCILPYTILRKAGFQMVRFRTATLPLEGDLSLDEEKSFLNSVVEHFRSVGADLILPSGNTAIFRTYPDGADAAPYGTVIKDLSQSEAVLWSELRMTHRQNIRKAKTAGVEIRCGLDYLDASYELTAETMKRSGASFKTYREYKRRILGLGENVKIFVAIHHSKFEGCMVAPFSLHTAYDCYAGSAEKPVRGAMPLLHWEAICQFRAMGVKFFDFQGMRIGPETGSKQEGIAGYKRGFGGNVVEGYVWKFPLRPLKFAAYSLAVRLLMGGDTVDQERHKLVGATSAG